MKTKKAKKFSPKKEQQKKIIWAALGVGTAGILGYFGWKYFKNKQEEKTAEPVVNYNWPAPPKYTPTNAAQPAPKPAPAPKPRYTPPPRVNIPVNSDEFPLRRGSRGDNVRALQEALIEQYGRAILPRYGADGQFGGEMTAALKKLKLPASIDQSTFNVLVKKKPTSKASLAKQIFDAAAKKDFSATVLLLKQIKDKDGYSQTSEEFKQMRLPDRPRQTLVNAMLNTFTTEAQKQTIRFEFLRMGLQYDGNKWALNGLGGLPLVTIAPAYVWANATRRIRVPAQTVLGNELSKRLDYTLFENKGQHFLVQTNLVKYL
jgi:hypothetical protein